MDFNRLLEQHIERITPLIDRLDTEEATKMSLIMPFLQLLGYNVFNPNEVVPEYTADVGVKKGEKVDYAIMSNKKPVILIEAKHCSDRLSNHETQLFRYFTATEAKFAILTNGYVYKFFTDLNEGNKLDSMPFLEVDLTKITDAQTIELKKFHKDNFDKDAIFSNASELRYLSAVKQLVDTEFKSPSEEYLKYVADKVYEGRKTRGVIEQFRGIVKKALNQYLAETFDGKLKSIVTEAQRSKDQEAAEAEAAAVENVRPKIVTTKEEIEAYAIVKNIIRDDVDINRIFYKDTESYLAILLDNNTRKWICRIRLESKNKYLYIPDENKKIIAYSIENRNSIYQYANEIKGSLLNHLQ